MTPAPRTAPVHHWIFLDGALHRASAGAARIERRRPGDGVLTSTFAAGSRADVDAAVVSSLRALREGPWGRTSPAARSAMLLRAADALERAEISLAECESEEVGKPWAHALDDVRGGVALWRYAAASVRSLHGEFYPSIAAGTQGFTFWEPVGVVGLIVPWNFPFIVTSERLPFMLAAGCTVVVKPSEHAGGSLVRMAQILSDAGLPAGVCNVVTGLGAEAGAALVEHPDVAMISFTGSSENGRRVMAAASPTLKRLSLELGGKSPVVVFEDADLGRAVEAVVAGFTHNAGQCCIATTRLIVARRIADRFTEMLAARLGRRDPSDVAFSQPVATGTQHARFAEGLASAAAEGRIVTGGAESDGRGFAVRPTVVTDVPADARVATDEWFGPLLTVHPFDTEEEALALANHTRYGLAAAVWSGDVDRAMRMARGIRAGRLWINSAQENFPELSIGGFGASGFGREAGTLGIRTYCEQKSLVMKEARPRSP